MQSTEVYTPEQFWELMGMKPPEKVTYELKIHPIRSLKRFLKSKKH